MVRTAQSGSNASRTKAAPSGQKDSVEPASQDQALSELNQTGAPKAPDQLKKVLALVGDINELGLPDDYTSQIIDALGKLDTPRKMELFEIMIVKLRAQDSLTAEGVLVRGGFGASTRSLAALAEQFGTAYFIAVLIVADPVLAEAVSNRDSIGAEEAKGTRTALRNLMLEQRDLVLSSLCNGLGEILDGENSLTLTHLVKGALRPYLEISALAPVSWQERISTKLFGPKQPLLALGITTPNDARFFDKLTEVDPDQETEEEYLDYIVNSKLVKIFDLVTNNRNLLSALKDFVITEPSLNLAELHLLITKMPYGVNWGCDNNFSTLTNGKKPEETSTLGTDLPEFESMDLAILFLAISKTTLSEGIELLPELGGMIEYAVRHCQAYKGAPSADFKDKLGTFFVNETSKMNGRFLS